MEIVDDHDHIGGLDTQSRISIFEVVPLRHDVQAAPLCLGAKGLDRIGISIDRTHGQAALGEPECMSTTAAGDIDRSP